VIVEACAVLPDAIRFGVIDRTGAWIACAELLPAADVGLFANDATLESARGRGVHTAIIQERLRAVTAGEFSLLAAEVAPGSTSERNYFRCGFYLAYTRAHYARRLD
jgi:N-acetylglutamate synthase-like GNAT family acetyltransferase